MEKEIIRNCGTCRFYDSSNRTCVNNNNATFSENGTGLYMKIKKITYYCQLWMFKPNEVK